MTIPIESKVNLHLTPSGTGCRLLINDLDVSDRAYKVEICAEVDKPTSVIVYFRLLDVTALGDTWVQYIQTPRKAVPYEAISEETL